MKKLRYLLEYMLALPLLLIVDNLSPRGAERFAYALANIYYFIAPGRRWTALDNILKAGICSTRSEAAAIAKESFRHLALVVVESLRSLDVISDPEAFKKRVKIDIPPALVEMLHNEKQGVILATGHYGNWEIAAQLLAQAKPVVGVARGANNPYVHRLLDKRRSGGGFHLMPKYDRNNISRFVQALSEGKILALMVDQHASWRGMRVDFFGRPASTQTAVALLHLVTGAPICFGYCRKTGPESYEMKAVGPLKFERTGDKDRDIRAILETLNGLLEAAVREAPEQYLWAHRRWKKWEYSQCCWGQPYRPAK